MGHLPQPSDPRRQPLNSLQAWIGWRFLLAIGLIGLAGIVGYLAFWHPQGHEIYAPQEIPTLSIIAEPAGASILLDGKPPQIPPNTFTRVPFGRHRLTADLEGYLPAQQDLEINQATSPKIGLKLQPVATELAALTVQTEPAGASLLLDGTPPQKPPDTFTHVPFGRHRLCATLPGYQPLTQDIEVREGKSPAIALKLPPVPSEIAALPTFFPPRATDSLTLPIQLAGEQLTLKNLSDRLTDALQSAGYRGKCSYYWLDDLHGPGFAIVTHIEHIQPNGKPVLDQRWGFDLPRYGRLTLVSMLKALINADPGRYRLLALVVCKQPLVEKETPMTTDQVQELSAGPKWLGDSPWKMVVATVDFHLIAYVYEFERKSRSDDPALMVSSDLTAEQHLRSTALYDNIEKYLSK